jgi:hypothetical protein
MGLDSSDSRPDGIAFGDAYTAIRSWYRANVGRFQADQKKGRYAMAAKKYIESMPEPASASRENMLDAFRRVLSGDLEWAYHESDGHYKMAAYAHAACEAAGVDPFRRS